MVIPPLPLNVPRCFNFNSTPFGCVKNLQSCSSMIDDGDWGSRSFWGGTYFLVFCLPMDIVADPDDRQYVSEQEKARKWAKKFCL